MRLFGRKGSSEKLTVKRVKGYVFKDCKLIRTFGLFVTVKDHDTHQIHMADFIDNYSTSRRWMFLLKSCSAWRLIRFRT